MRGQPRAALRSVGVASAVCAYAYAILHCHQYSKEYVCTTIYAVANAEYHATCMLTRCCPWKPVQHSAQVMHGDRIALQADSAHSAHVAV